MKLNTVTYNSFIKDIEKQLRAENRALLQEAGNVVAKEMKKNIKSMVKKKTGNLLKSVGKKINRNGTSIRIGVRKGKSEGGGGDAHAHLIEHGHDVIAYADGKKHSKGEKIGEAKPIPFMKISFENTEKQVKEILSRERLKK